MNPFRVDIVNLLNLIADYSSQKKYQDAVPYVGVPDEIVCQWFDDLYHPNTDIFESAFSKKEKLGLAEFNDTFDEYADNLPQTIQVLHKSKKWKIVSKEAYKVLEKFGWLGLELSYDSQ